MNPNEITGGCNLIVLERLRQVQEEGWSAEHDDQHGDGELVEAARAYCRAANGGYAGQYLRPNSGFAPADWPFERSSWKPGLDPIRNLVKAGALIAAEIDRLERAGGSG